MKDIFVYSRQAIEAIEPHEVPHIIVSITTPGDPALPEGAKIKTNEHTLKILRLTFHDLDQHFPGIEELESDLFQPSQARQILALVKTYPEAQRFIVHCDAGLSRSPAVGAALSKIWTGDDTYFFKRYHPNMRVYRTILEEHYAPPSGV
jgi:predicted protein tyrosine phosphatase